jgi:hypothetical protein
MGEKLDRCREMLQNFESRDNVELLSRSSELLNSGDTKWKGNEPASRFDRPRRHIDSGNIPALGECPHAEPSHPAAYVQQSRLGSVGDLTEEGPVGRVVCNGGWVE